MLTYVYLPHVTQPFRFILTLSSDLEHAACIENSPSPDRDCPLCKKPLLHSSGNDPLSQTIQKRFRNTFLKALEMLPTSTASRDTLKQWSKEDSAKASNTSTEHASLRIYETESGTASKVMSESSNINEEGGKISYGLTQQAPANDTQRTASRVSTTAAGTAVSHPENGASRFHVSLDLPVPKVDRKSRNLSYVKSGGVGHRSGSSTTVRKIAKLGNRRIMELKKLVSERRRHISIFVAFMTCIVLIALLMSGEDTLKAINKPIVEEVSLPNVRVNPAFLQAQSQGQQDRKQE